MAAPLKANSIALLASVSGVDMETDAPTTVNLFRTQVGKVTRISHIVIRDYNGSLAGGTDFDFLNWRQTVDLSAFTTANTGYIYLGNYADVEFTEIAADTMFTMTVNSGSTATVTATIDIFGYISD